MLNNKALAAFTGGLLFAGALAAGVVLTGGLSASDSASAGEEDDETPTPEEEDETPTPDEDEGEEDGVTRFHELLAEELGVTVDELEEAFSNASLALIDEAEADGRLSAEEADRARERVEEGRFFPVFRSGFHHGFAFGRLAPFDGIAELLGMTEEDLRAAVRDGQSLAEVAESAGVSLEELTAEVLANVRESLDEAVANDGLTQELADEIFERFESNIEDFLTRDFDEAGSVPNPAS
jgi:chromosome condensin MukBEF complex kleisin-like MukF subunit